MRKVLILIIVVMFGSVSFGAFYVINPSARAMGMGNAFTGVADDVNSAVLIPAGLANTKNWDVTFSYSRLFMGIANLGESYAALVYPMGENGSIGAAWLSFNDDVYTESTIALCYAYPVKMLEASSVGLNIKYLTKSYLRNEWTDPAVNSYFASGLSASAISFGLSLYSRITKQLTFGLFIDDFNQPNTAINGEEKLYLTLRAGLGYNYDKDTTIAIDYYNRNEQYKLHAGVETVASKIEQLGNIYLRAGGGYGADGYMNVTAGLGFKFNFMKMGTDFNYGFMFPLNSISGSSGTHRFSLGLTEPFKAFKSEKEILEEENR